MTIREYKRKFKGAKGMLTSLMLMEAFYNKTSLTEVPLYKKLMEMGEALKNDSR